MPSKSQKITQEIRISRAKRGFAVLLTILIALSSSPLPVLAGEISPMEAKFLETDIVSAEIEQLAEQKPELKQTHSEVRQEKIQEAREDDSKKWTERIVLGKLERGDEVGDVLGKRKDAEKVVADLKEAGVIITMADATSGEEKEINPTLKKNSKNKAILETTETPYGAEISTDSSEPMVLSENSEAAGNVVSAETSDSQVADDATPDTQEEIRYFNWNANSVEGSQEENKILYRDLWNATDLLTTMGEMGVKEDIILKDSTAPTEFNYIVETIGLELQTTDDGGYIFLDENGDEKFYTPAPNITDADGNFVENGIHYELGWATSTPLADGESLSGSSSLDSSRDSERDPVLAEVKFDEGEGEVLADEKSENVGTLGGAKWFADGIRKSALLFDGEDYLEIPRDFEFNKTMTISAWVKSSKYQNAQITGIGRNSLQQDAEKGWKATFRVDDKNLNVAWKTSALYLEKWYHLVATFDGEKIRLYTDGEEENYLEAAGSLTPNAEPILIGGGNGNFAGVIDEVQIYDHALSAEEVRELHQKYLEPEIEEEISEITEEEIEEIEVVEEADLGTEEVDTAEEIEVIEESEIEDDSEDPLEDLFKKFSEIGEQIVLPEESSRESVGSDGQLVIESDAEKTSTEEITPTETPIEEIPVVEEAPVEEITPTETPTGEVVPAEEIPVVEEVPVEEIVPTEEVVVPEEIPAEEIPAIEETPNEETPATSFFDSLKAFFLPVANAAETAVKEDSVDLIQKSDATVSIEKIVESNAVIEAERINPEDLPEAPPPEVEMLQDAVEEILATENAELTIQNLETPAEEIIPAEEASAEEIVEPEIEAEEIIPTEAETVESEEVPTEEASAEEVVPAEISTTETSEEEIEVIAESEIENLGDENSENPEEEEIEIEVIEESEVEKFFAPEKILKIEIEIAADVEIAVLSEQEVFAQSSAIVQEVKEEDGTILRRYKLRLVIDVLETWNVKHETEEIVPAEEGVEGADEEVPAEESVEGADEEVTPTETVEGEEAPVEGSDESVVSEGQSVVESETEETSIEEVILIETPAEEIVPTETPAEETPAEEVIPIETPAEEVPAETPTEETPAEEIIPTEIPAESAEIEAENLGASVLDVVAEEVEIGTVETETEIAADSEQTPQPPLAGGLSSFGAEAEVEIELSKTLTLKNGTILTYPLDLDPSTYIRLVNRGARTFAPNFEDGNQNGQYSQTNNPGAINRGTEGFIPQNGLVGYWPMDGDWADDSTNSNNGTAAGGATFTDSGKWGEAGSFDGVDDYVSAASVDLGLNGTSEMSISGWFYIDTITPAQRLVQKQIVDGWSSISLMIYAGGSVSLSAQNSSLSQYPTWATSSAITTGWHHIIGTFDKNNIDSSDGKIYIDGVDQSTTFSALGYTSSFTIQESSNNLLFGARPVTLTYPFDGKMDDVAIYNRALSATEILQMYNGGRVKAANPQVTAVDADGAEFLGNNSGSSQDWVATGDSLKTNVAGSKVRYTTEVASEIWAGMTLSPAGGIVRVVIDKDTDIEIVNEIDTYAETIQTEQKVLLATGLRNSTHTVELELTGAKNPKADAYESGVENLQNGLVGWWKLNESTLTDGSTITDYSTSFNDGTTAGTMTSADSVNGVFDSALDFDGVDDYVEIADDASLDITDMLTTSMWVKTDGSDIQTTALSKGWNNLRVIINGTNTIRVVWNTGGVDHTVITTDVVAPGEWQHIVVTYDRSNINIYLNGSLVKQGAASGDVLTNDTSLKIGTYTSALQFFDGSIDDVAIYNRALSSAEISALYESKFAFSLDYLETHPSQYELAGAGIASTADSGTTTTIVDAALTQADDYWNGYALEFTSGSNNGEVVFVTDFVAATDTLTFTPAVGTAVGTETFKMSPDGVLINARASRGVTPRPSGTPLVRGAVSFDVLGNLPTTADGKAKKGTFSTWVSPDFASNADTNKHYVFDSGLQRLYYDGVGDKFHFEIYNPSTSSGQVANWETVDVTSAAQSFSAHANLHLAASWDADSGLKLFVNGVKTVKSVKWDAQAISAGAKTMTIGAKGDHLARELEDDLVAYYPMDGDWKDYSQNSNDGTASGASFGDGEFNKSGEFNGSDDYISLPTSLPDAPTALSVSFWVNPDSWTTDGGAGWILDSGE
ncbi:hypothetical protein K9N08_00405, partial [Candidatus Gracilibacteria bacterium]|nr:hypothetical protein [Candidatus Gracilibacteria bacterium]MCF7856007.1 hypothetical protein [Candidatus Gracilibacteria bacterium]MCF7896438.1 hypothetical protein [Candidatus Gracilibacteria bacterium]